MYKKEKELEYLKSVIKFCEYEKCNGCRYAIQVPASPFHYILMDGKKAKRRNTFVCALKTAEPCNERAIGIYQESGNSDNQ